MPTKLTLRLDERLIARAKRYAARRGTSVSQMVADYFAALTADETPARPDDDWKQHLSPITRSLVGSLAGSGLDEEDYHRHLEEKHR